MHLPVLLIHLASYKHLSVISTFGLLTLQCYPKIRNLKCCGDTQIPRLLKSSRRREMHSRLPLLPLHSHKAGGFYDRELWLVLLHGIQQEVDTK